MCLSGEVIEHTPMSTSMVYGPSSFQSCIKLNTDFMLKIEGSEFPRKKKGVELKKIERKNTFVSKMDVAEKRLFKFLI